MIWKFFLSFGRNLRNNKLLSLINIFTLSIGFAVFSMSALYVHKEMSYDSGWSNAKRIHRTLVQWQGLPGRGDGSGYSLDPSSYQSLLSYFSDQIEAATRLPSAPVQLQVGQEEVGNIIFLTFADPEFEFIFDLQVLDGSLTRVLGNPGLIALSESRAIALGDSGRVGESLLVKTPYNGGEQEFEVGAIIRLPEPTSHAFEMLTVIGEHASELFVSSPSPPWEASTPVRLLLKPRERTQDLNDQMPNFVASALADNYGQFDTGSIDDHVFYELQPIQEIYLNRGSFEEDILIFGDKSKVIIFAAVGLIVLLVGCSNSASLSFANALRRRREVGIRKTLGAGKKIIVLHYLGESVLIALIACGLAVALQELLAIPVQTLFNISGELSPSLASSGLLLVIAVFIGLFSGAYPAVLLSTIRPQSALKSNAESGGNGVFRARIVLVGGQLALTVMFLASAFGLYAQLIMVQNQSLGYDHTNLLYVSHSPSSSSSVPNASVVANNVLDLSGVMAATPMVTPPPNMNLPLNINASNLVSKNEFEMEVQSTRLMVAEGFIEMLGIPLLSGRMLDGVRDSWTNSQNSSEKVEHVLINRRAVEALGFTSPKSAVDQLVYMRSSDVNGQLFDAPMRIVGVLEDSLYSSIHRLPVPEFYALPSDTSTSQYMLRFEPATSSDIQEDVASLFESYGIEPNLLFIESRIESAHLQQRDESRLLLITAGIALLISCIGMYGLVTAAVVSSVKEVGVRKVLGASTLSILGLFLWRFSRPALFANLIAWPIAGWFVLRWIQQFPYQIEFIWFSLIFIFASLVVLLVIWLTIIAVTAQAARCFPASSLQYE